MDTFDAALDLADALLGPDANPGEIVTAAETIEALDAEFAKDIFDPMRDVADAKICAKFNCGL